MMALTVLALTAAACWDAQREAAAALEDFASEQTALARTVAADLSMRLRTMRPEARGAAPAASTPGGPVVDERAAAVDLLGGLEAAEHPGESVVLVLPPGAGGFRTADGGVRRSAALAAALEGGEVALRLDHLEAVGVGLPARLAIAGLARVDAGPLGRWGVAVVSSALRQRDREHRARWRLALSVTSVGGLVLAFGGLALRKQRDEMRLQRELAIEGERQAQGERLARATRAAALGTFASGIAHEIATPLAVIAGRAEQLAGRVSDDRSARAVRTILDQAGSINQVVRGFLSLAHGETISLRQSSPADIAASALSLVDHRFASAAVALRAEIARPTPPVACDARLLELALVNLLLNACDACAPGGHVVLSVETDAASLSFVVRDDGAGIDAASAARASEPLFAVRPQRHGGGIGLAITSEIVRMNRGELLLRAAAGRGTVARIVLPLQASDG
jgi:signal transduction histidine kinase